MMFLTLKRVTAMRVAAAGVAAVLLVACGQDSPERLLSSAKDYLAKGDRSAAVIQLKNLLDKKPPYDPGFSTTNLYDFSLFDIRGRQIRLGFVYKL